METVLVVDSFAAMCQVRQHSAYIMGMHLQQTHLNPENEGSMFFQSTGVHVQDVMVAATRKSYSVQ
jgi:hypothetical protein